MENNSIVVKNAPADTLLVRGQGWGFNAHFISRKTALMALPIIAYMYYVSCKHNTQNHINRDLTS